MRSRHIGHTLTFNVAPGTMSLLRIVEFSSNSPVNIKNLFTGLKGGSNRIQHELMKRELKLQLNNKSFNWYCYFKDCKG